MKNYTITVNGNVYDVTVEENTNGAPAAAPAPRAAAPAPAPAAPVAEAPAKSEMDQSQLIAVITAAIAASEGKDPRQYIVRSIKKVHRNQW